MGGLGRAEGLNEHGGFMIVSQAPGEIVVIDSSLERWLNVSRGG